MAASQLLILLCTICYANDKNEMALAFFIFYFLSMIVGM